MAAYSYVAIDALGAELTGEISAPDVRTAREQLRQRGLVAELLREAPTEGPESIRSGLKPVKPTSLQLFSRQFATMIQAGLPIVGALATLEDEIGDRHLAIVIREVRQNVEQGMPLHQAMARHPRVFGGLFVAMVEAGEATGLLQDVLGPVAAQIERETQVRRRVRGAFVYPGVVLSFAFVVLAVMLLFVVPMFQSMYTQLGGSLPRPTQIVVSASGALRHDWFIVLPALVAVAMAARSWSRTPDGKDRIDRVKLRLPLRLGDTVRKIALAHFARTLATLVEAGVDVVRALEITGQAVGNSVIERSLATVRRQVRAGAPLSVPLAADPVFPSMLSQMVRIGEETGELGTMLRKIVDFYEDEADTTLKSLTSVIEPLMIIGVGAVVGGILITMYLPMFRLMTLVH